MIETIIPYRERSIGAFSVRRVLPFAKRRSVGPFVFVDDFGPVEIMQNNSLDVLLHPHIGLATVTYLFKGKMTHRDSIGSVQVIEPGEVNWMTAGKGIVHSERVSDVKVKPNEQLLGLQTWVALPENKQEIEPTFSHHNKEDLPVLETNEMRLRVILGEIFDKKSPVETLSNPVYAECTLKKGAEMELPKTIEDRSIYVLKGSVLIEDEKFDVGKMIVFEIGKEVIIEAEEDSFFMIIGGDKLEKQRFMYWNFVSTSKDRIETAKEDWKNRRFKMIPKEEGFVPLPKF